MEILIIIVSKFSSISKSRKFEIIFFLSTISNFLSEVKEEIKEQCSIYLRQVELFLENYSCSSNSSDLILIISKKIFFE
jgi:hypothetical protein